MQKRRGTTLVEQMVVLTVLGVLAALAFRSIGNLLDRLAVRNAGRDTRDMLAAAREHAVAGGVRTAVQIDPASGAVSIHAGSDTVLVRQVGPLYSVRFSTSRDSMAYSPSGLGYGASNLRVVLVRGSAAETVTVSRLGRVR